MISQAGMLEDSKDKVLVIVSKLHYFLQNLSLFLSSPNLKPLSLWHIFQTNDKVSGPHNKSIPRGMYFKHFLQAPAFRLVVHVDVFSLVCPIWIYPVSDIRIIGHFWGIRYPDTFSKTTRIMSRHLSDEGCGIVRSKCLERGNIWRLHHERLQ